MYPPIEPLDTGMLDVGDDHLVYWETVGNPDGTRVVYLHGGPGSGCSPGTRRYFDPAKYCAVIFDQRGCGRSRPLALHPDVDLSTNTTDHLVADIERLRTHLGIERWVVVGVSWGSTLALVYAQRNPERVLGIVLGGVTAGSHREKAWITREVGRIFPEAWEEFVDLVPEPERGGDLAAAYARLLASGDPELRVEAARRWRAWEDTHPSLAPGWSRHPKYDDPVVGMVFARLVTHYWSHGCFLADGEIQAGMERLRDVPGIMVHGRLDISSPLDTAWALHRAWPASELVVLDDAGHGSGSFGPELVAAIDRIVA